MYVIPLQRIQDALLETKHAGLQHEFRRDASLASNMARELEYVYSEVILQEHPDKPFGEGQIIPIDDRPGPGAQTYVYYEMGGTATAIVLNTYGDNELPEVGLFSRKHVGQIESMGNSWSYNVDDLLAAAISPTTGNLLQMKPQLAQRGHVQAWNDKGLFGDNDYNWNGFLDHPNVPHIAAALPWDVVASQANIDNILGEVDTLLNTPFFITNGLHTPNRLLVPQAVFAFWRFQRLSFGAADLSQTMLSWLQTHHPNVQIGWLLECDASKTGGQLADSRAICFIGDNREIVALVRTLDFTQHEGQWKGLKFKTPCQSKFGGTKWNQPLTGAIATGVQS